MVSNNSSSLSTGTTNKMQKAGGRRSRLSLGGEHLQRAMAAPPQEPGDDADIAATRNRRKTISIVGETTMIGADKENNTLSSTVHDPAVPVVANTPAPVEKATATSTGATTTATATSHMKSSSKNRHHHHDRRLHLPDSVSAYYFSGVSKTPFGKELSTKTKQQQHLKSPAGKTGLSAKKRLATLLDESSEEEAAADESSSNHHGGGGSSMMSMDESFDNNSKFARYDGSVGAAESSFLSTASSSSSTGRGANSSSSSSSGGDILNQSVLSDTTELTPANFILQARSRQFIQQSNNNNNKHAQREAAVADAARTSKTVEEQHAATASHHQDKGSSMDVVAMEEDQKMAMEPEAPPARPPLPAAAAATGKDRRKTLATAAPGGGAGSGFFQLTQASEMDDTPLSTRSRRRETLLGPIPGGGSSITAKQPTDMVTANEATKKALTLVAKLRDKREKRNQDRRDSEVSSQRLSTGSTMSLDIPQSLLLGGGGGGYQHTSADDEDDSSTTTELPLSQRTMQAKEPIDDDNSTTALDLPASLLAAAAPVATKNASKKPFHDNGSIVDDDASTALELPASLLAAAIAAKPGQAKARPSDDFSTGTATLELPESLLQGAGTKPTAGKGTVVVDDSSSNMELRPPSLQSPFMNKNGAIKQRRSEAADTDSLNLSFGSLFDDMTENPAVGGGRVSENQQAYVSNKMKDAQSKRNDEPDENNGLKAVPDSISFNPSALSSISKRSSTTPTRLKGSPRRMSQQKKKNLMDDSPARDNAVVPTDTLGSPAALQKNKHSVGSGLVDSPARNTRSKTSTPSGSLVASPANNTRSKRSMPSGSLVASPAKNTRSKASTPSGSLVASPAKNTRSKSNTPDSKKRKHEPPGGSDSPVADELSAAPGSDLKRHKSSAFAEVGKKQLHGVPPELASKLSSKKSAPGSARKTVIFGSPDGAEYNVGSPATSMTPMLHSKAKALYTMPDDTAEIEADMNAMFQNGRISQQANRSIRNKVAGTVDFATANLQNGHEECMQRNDNSDMELDSSSTSSSDGPVGDNEDPTEELETCMADLLNGAGGKKARTGPVQVLAPTTEETFNSLEDEKQEIVEEADQTEELESNLVDILNGATASNERDGLVESDCTQQLESNLADILNVTNDTSQSKRVENEQTEELEDNLEDMLDSTDDHHVARVVHNDDTTRELECNMRDILESGDSPQLPSRKTRRKTSRRFSIRPKSRLSLSADGSVLDFSGMCLDITSGESDVGKLALQPEEIAPVLDLKVEEVLAVIGPPVDNLNPLGDILVEIGDSIRDCATADVVVTMNDCLKSVCEKVESTIPEINPHLFSNMQENEQKALLALQVALRSKQSASVKKELVKLSSLIGRAESQEFCSWFVNVAEQLHSHILTFVENTRADQERIKKEAALLDEVEGILAEMESQAARRARRESYERRKKNTDSLQQELDQMEQQVKIAEDAMNHSKKMNQIVSDLSDEASRCSSLTRELEDLIPAGTTAGRQWTTLKGLNVWMPRAITSTEMTFSYVGPCPKACVTVSFPLSGTSSVPCKASVDPLAFPKHKSRNGGKLQLVMPLLASRTSVLCEKMSREKADPTQIGAFLRRNGWDLCRIEITASELALLQRRYRATLSSNLSGEGLSHILEVDFQSRTTSCKIRGSFSISDAYPFDALNTQLDVVEGETLLDELQQLLVKNAKPGFGYLSRTCDVIAAYLR